MTLEMMKLYFFGYSLGRNAYKCYNTTLNKNVESVDVNIYEVGHQKLKEKVSVQAYDSCYKE